VSEENRQQKIAPETGSLPIQVAEEAGLLRLVLNKLDAPQTRPRTAVDDAGTLIELRDALAEAKPEDQGPLMAEMHRVEALSRQRGKGDSPPVDRRSPYFAHLRLMEGDRRRDVLIGQRGFVERGGGVQIVDWRNAPVSRLFYRYEEGDYYEEQLGDKVVEGEVVARRTVSIVDSELRRVACGQGIWARAGGSDQWKSVAAQHTRLSVGRDGSVKGGEPVGAPAAKADRHSPARLGFEADGTRRMDRFLPAIAALIDPRQFELISRPSSGLIVVQGTAGSGKTTIGLHRIAYLAFADPEHFRPRNMLVVVYQRALATYVSQVLPALDVPGVAVRTFSAWAESMRRSTFPNLNSPTGAPEQNTPPLVMRAKSHGAMLKLLADRQADIAAWCRAELESGLANRPELAVVLAAWDGTRGPVDERVTALARWSRHASLSAAGDSALEAVGRRIRARTRDVVGEWASLLTDRKAMAEGFGRHAPGLFSETQLASIHRWCVDRERLRQAAAAGDADETWALDQEDDTLLLRMHQLQRGPLGGKEPIVYDHLMVDEVQDFAPLELAVLLDSTSRRRSITLAGDTNQSIVPEHGFSSWTQMLEDLGIAHDRVEPLRVSYRSTREIMESALHVLGPLGGDMRPVAPRRGAPVEAFGFSSAGECSDFLARALRDLVYREPLASVALIARHAEQARLYYEAMAAAEVPELRLVAEQDFTFRAGIDVTDVVQTKGLEFDVVILLEVTEESYPNNDLARRMLHVAMTRAAHQLWITHTGPGSPLLPESLR
jgi:DNA helicase-2/ATP-dependent DNA helicase PcrA